MNITTSSAPFTLTLNGKEYEVPRFLLPAMKQQSAAIIKKYNDESTAHFDADQKARFLRNFPARRITVPELATWAVSTDGMEPVIRGCLTKAKVPNADIDDLINNGDTLQLYDLADALCAAAKLSDAGKDIDPKNQASNGSGGSPATTPQTSATSEPSTPEPIPTV